MKTWVVDSGGVSRALSNHFFVVDSGGVTRAVKKIFVVDSGGVTRQVYQNRAAESGSITVGTNGTAYGYQQSSFGSITGFPLTGGTLSDSKVIVKLADLSPPGGNSTLIINGFSSDPGQSYFNSIVNTTTSTTKTSASASYVYGSGSATWTWTGSTFGFSITGTHSITLNF